MYNPGLCPRRKVRTMKLTVDVNALSGALGTVTRALAVRVPKPVMEGVLLDARDDELVLSCTDGNFAIECTVPCKVEENGRTVFSGRFFADMIRKLPSGDVSLTVDDNNLGHLRCGGVRTSLQGMNAMEFPEMAEVEDGRHVKLSQVAFKNMISRVAFAVAVDEARQILTGILMELRPGEMRLVALDGFRLAMQTAQVTTEEQELTHIICPGKVMNELSRVLSDEEEECDICFDPKHMIIRFGHTVLSTVLMSGQYIDYQRILPQTFTTRTKLDRSQLSSAIDFASLYAREAKNNLVKINCDNDLFGISSNAELGDFHQDIEIYQDGPGVQIAFNAKYLTDVLRAIPDDEICMNFNTSIQPCVITPVEGDSFLYLILPVRVFQ